MKAEPNTFVVTLSNCQCEVELDEYNSDFGFDMQVLEAASRAVEVFKGLRKGPKLKLFLDSQKQEPSLGVVLLVQLKNGGPDKAAIVLSHVCFANAGFYMESIEMMATLGVAT